MSHRLLRTIALFTGLASACALAVAAPAANSGASAPILPASFAGWAETAPAQVASTPEAADAPNADVLREYGLKEFAASSYAHGKQTLAVHAFRFVDATGAYGAYTWYRLPQMKSVDLGKEGAEAGSHVVFWKGVTVVDATFPTGSAMDRAALQTLAAMIEQPGGPAGVPPSLTRYLPSAGAEKNSVHYAIGPLAYARSGGVLPADAIDFSADAEALTAQYASRSGNGTLTLLMYPTPQIAAGRARAIQTLIESGGLLKSGNGSTDAPQQKRSGPLVAVTSGGFTQDEARQLLAQVKFADYVTLDRPQGYISEVVKTARVLKGIATLTVVLCGAAVLLGLFLGGGRAAIRVMRGKPASSLGDEEFISLRLSEEAGPNPAPSKTG
jgi:hypothetical protein